MQTLEIRGWEINVNDRRLNRIKKISYWIRE